MALAAVVDEGGLEAGLDVDHHRLVNVGLGLLPGRGFQGKLIQLPFGHDDYPEFLRVRHINEHLPRLGHRLLRKPRRRNSRNPGWRSWACMRLTASGREAGLFKLRMGRSSRRRK